MNGQAFMVVAIFQSVGDPLRRAALIKGSLREERISIEPLNFYLNCSTKATSYFHYICIFSFTHPLQIGNQEKLPDSLMFTN